jgi:hypothetical protein
MEVSFGPLARYHPYFGEPICHLIRNQRTQRELGSNKDIVATSQILLRGGPCTKTAQRTWTRQRGYSQYARNDRRREAVKDSVASVLGGDALCFHMHVHAHII